LYGEKEGKDRGGEEGRYGRRKWELEIPFTLKVLFGSRPTTLCLDLFTDLYI
jgi:hypothetical protein